MSRLVESVRDRLAHASPERVALVLAQTALTALFFVATIRANELWWAALFGVLLAADFAVLGTIAFYKLRRRR